MCTCLGSFVRVCDVRGGREEKGVPLTLVVEVGVGVVHFGGGGCACWHGLGVEFGGVVSGGGVFAADLVLGIVSRWMFIACVAMLW